MVLDGGAEILDSTMLEHDLTAEEMEAYAVTVQVVTPAAEVVVGGAEVDTAVDELLVVARCL
jgi:hypothetical protein